jgi:hypothetical protein
MLRAAAMKDKRPAPPRPRPVSPSKSCRDGFIHSDEDLRVREAWERAKREEKEKAELVAAAKSAVRESGLQGGALVEAQAHEERCVRNYRMQVGEVDLLIYCTQPPANR